MSCKVLASPSTKRLVRRVCLLLLLDSSQLELENVEQVGECDVGMMFMLWSINLGRIVVIMEIDDRSRW